MYLCTLRNGYLTLSRLTTHDFSASPLSGVREQKSLAYIIMHDRHASRSTREQGRAFGQKLVVQPPGYHYGVRSVSLSSTRYSNSPNS